MLIVMVIVMMEKDKENEMEEKKMTTLHIFLITKTI